MIPYFCFDKIIIGPVTIYIWGIFIALAFLISYLFVLKQAKKEKVDTKIIHNLFIWILLGGMIGGKLLGQGGLSFLGGVLGALIAATVCFKLTKTGFNLFFPIADLVALIAPISIAIGRIGCSLINDHQGAETQLPWGIVWPDGVIRHPVAE